jgi:hypothetical protein
MSRGWEVGKHEFEYEEGKYNGGVFLAKVVALLDRSHPIPLSVVSIYIKLYSNVS